jgi:hypothetical protein
MRSILSIRSEFRLTATQEQRIIDKQFAHGRLIRDPRSTIHSANRNFQIVRFGSTAVESGPFAFWDVRRRNSTLVEVLDRRFNIARCDFAGFPTTADNQKDSGSHHTPNCAPHIQPSIPQGL